MCPDTKNFVQLLTAAEISPIENFRKNPTYSSIICGGMLDPTDIKVLEMIDCCEVQDACLWPFAQSIDLEE